MADSKHRPGPWMYTPCDHEVGHVSTSPDGYGDVATTWPSGGDAKANAHLIAAAPELLDALKEATLALDGMAKGEGVFKPIEQTIVLARNVIAKAEGRS